MNIKGYLKSSFIDYPDKIASVVFLGGCNYRCPYCHNGDLVCNDDCELIDLDEIRAHIKKRKGLIDGVVITGGEPTLAKGLIDFLEEFTGQKFNLEKVRKAVAYSNEANKYWKQFLDLAIHRPSGITVFDTFVHMAPYITSMRGSRSLVKHFKILAREGREMVSQGTFPVPKEKYRLLWDNIPIWFNLYDFFNTLAQKGVVTERSPMR